MRGVGDHFPARRRAHLQLERRLEVGLVEAGEHPLGVRSFELGVQVYRAIRGVHETMQAFTGVRIDAVGHDSQFVVLGKIGQRDARLLVVLRHIEVDAVQRGGPDTRGDDVDERRGAWRRRERDGRGGHEGLLTGIAGPIGEVEFDCVAGSAEHVRPFGSLVAGQVGSNHFAYAPSRSRKRCIPHIPPRPPESMVVKGYGGMCGGLPRLALSEPSSPNEGVFT